MSKKRKIVITWVITALVLLVGSLYITSILRAMGRGINSTGPVRWWLLVVVILVIMPVMIMMVVTAFRRKKEIEEGKDDPGKY